MTIVPTGKKPRKTFDGETFDFDQDFQRLTTQLRRVRYLLAHPAGKWWTLRDLVDKAGGSEAGVSARIRDLRKPRYGNHDIQRHRVGGGQWLYRLAAS